jgi:hypothetical protein
VDVQVVDDGGFNQVWITDTPEPLPQGSEGDVLAGVVFGPQSSGTIEVQITASSGDGETVQLTREIRVQRSGPTLCTIDNDDRIGDRVLEAEDEFFDCTIRINADQQYNVGFENSTATGGFELSAALLQAMEFEDSEIGGATDIAISQNANDDVSFETTTFGDDVSIVVEQVAQGITLEASTVEGAFDISTRNQNGDITIEDSDIDGNAGMVFDGPLSGDIDTGSSQIGGTHEIDVRDNLNGDITIEEASVGGDLIVTVDGNANGDITIEAVNVGGDVSVVVDGKLNGDVEISDSTVGGDLTVDTQRGGGSVELEGNSVGGTVTRP